MTERKPKLNNYEKTLLMDLASGKSRKTMAIDHGVQAWEIVKKVGEIYKALDARNETHAVIKGIKLGILNFDEIPITHVTRVPWNTAPRRY